MVNKGAFRDNYASVKARGVEPSDSVYNVIVHKRAVRKSGLELASDLPIRFFNPEFDGAVVGSTADVSASDTFAADLTRFESSVVRSKSAVVQLVANNDWRYFVTFTLDKDKVLKHYGTSRYNLEKLSKVIRKFMNHYKERRGLADFAYLLIPEFHKDGAVHFHGVMRGINKDDINENVNGYPHFVPAYERFGFSSVGVIKDLRKCANYIGKYISKDMFTGMLTDSDVTRRVKPSRHLYFCSKKLSRDKVLAVGECVYTPKDFLEAGYDPVLDNEYCTKYVMPDAETALGCIRPFADSYARVFYDAPVADVTADVTTGAVLTSRAELDTDAAARIQLFNTAGLSTGLTVKERKKATNRRLQVQQRDKLPQRPNIIETDAEGFAVPADAELATLGKLWDSLFANFTVHGGQLADEHAIAKLKNEWVSLRRLHYENFKRENPDTPSWVYFARFYAQAHTLNDEGAFVSHGFVLTDDKPAVNLEAARREDETTKRVCAEQRRRRKAGNAERLKTDVALRRLIAAGVIDFSDGSEDKPRE